MQLRLEHITHTYPDGATAALKDISAVFPLGWSGIIGDNGCGKTTLARIAARMITPDAGTIAPALFSVYCQQDSSDAPSDLCDFASDWSQGAQQLRTLLQIQDEWLWRYDTLSGGQRKRIQIACALAARPDVLIMDEPTNDLDAETKALIEGALASFKGIGILISHDRALLDALASQCLVFEDGRAHMRPGGYTKASGQAAQERAHALKEREEAKREARRLDAEAQRRSEEASRQKKKRSRSGLDKKDSDGRERIGRAIVTGKDGVAGKLSATMDRRRARMSEQLAGMHASKRYEHRFDDHGSVAQSSTIAHPPAATLTVGDFAIHVPELWIGPTDHIAISGRNGTGKSLIVRHILSTVPETVSVASVPQDVDRTERVAALRALHAHDPERKGRILSLVARLNSDPERLLDGSDLSPGELRKLMLAEQLLDDPSFLVFDEPTNHLDIGSILALQELLAGFPGAILLVSHDAALVDAVADIRWQTAHEEGAWHLRC